MSTRIAVCLPTRGECKSGFTFDLARMVNRTAHANPDLKLAFFSGTGSLIHDLRRDLAKRAVEAEADWILFLDDDMRFPPDALLRLLAHRRDIVGCNYTTRTVPPRPTAKRISDNGLDWLGVPTLSTDTGLAEVDGLGFGCILINARVFKALEEPWFSMPWSPHKQCHAGEDIFFCALAAKGDFSVFIDHDLSKEIKHVGSMEFSWDHFEAIQEIEAT